MSYQVIARKWRPQTFADVVGQPHVTRTLGNAVATGRVAHAYIFSGARGVGKTTTARILAKALNCVRGPAAEPCNECDSCREIAAGNSLDVLEIDAASNRGIDQVRELREMVRYAPAGGRYKVVILDEAHMLTPEASNALLKTLEEPPEKVVFVMATTQPEDLEETIRSRSQHFHFRALSFAEIVEALRAIGEKEGLQADEGALAVMARSADGSLRDAMSLLEQARAYCGTAITEAQVRTFLGVVSAEVLDELVGAIEARSAQRALSLVHRLLAEGQNLQQFCRELLAHFRNLLVVRVCGADSELVAAPAEERPRLARAAAAFSEEDLTRFFQIVLVTEDDLRRKPDPRLHLEIGLLRLVNAARLAPLEEALAELSGLAAPRIVRTNSAEIKLGTPAAPPPPNPQNQQRLDQSPTAPPEAPATRSAAARSNAAELATANVAAMHQATARNDDDSAPTAMPVSAMPVSALPVPTAPAPAPLDPPAAPQQLASSPGGDLRGADAGPGPVPGSMPSMIARTADSSGGLEAAQVASIKAAILSQQKFLGELVDSASRWELEGGEIRLYFPTESRALAELLQGRESMEKLRSISSRVLGQQLRVCVKLESAPMLGSTVRAAQNARELRARFEQDPIVRAMLDRFGGRISEVKRRNEE
jgi:DNA polymerase-3 subunit gamma/tau